MLACLFERSGQRGVHLQVYKAKMGDLDVAVKTIQKQHVNPQLTSQQALQVMQQVMTPLRRCATPPLRKQFLLGVLFVLDMWHMTKDSDQS